MALKNDIHRYKSYDASLLSLKKTQKTNEKDNHKTNERSFGLFTLFSVIITSLSYDNFFHSAAAKVFDHSLEFSHDEKAQKWRP